jgi:hypothetical protein
MTDVVLRYNDFAIMKAQLAEIGVTVHEPGEGQTLKTEGQFGMVNTPMLETANGDIVFSIRLSDEEADLLPLYVAPPEFVCDYRSDEVDEEGAPFDWPMYTISYPELDQDGVPTGVTLERQQGAGRIA